MNKVKVLMLALLAICLPATALAKDFPGIEALMSKEEFAATGLGKLTAGERRALDAWLLKYTTDDVPGLVEEIPELKESLTLRQAVSAKPEEEGPIASRITGDFNGWKGKTLFRLENGQVWKQRQTGFYRKKLERPEVKISKNLLGFYMLEVVETGRRIGVKRIK
ncbi:hypothetical protein [Thiolapillus sp.]